MIDWARVAELKNEVGEAHFDEIVELFLEEVEGGLSDLESATDLTARAGLFHFLRGAALNLGFAGLSELCAKGEGAPFDVNDREARLAFEQGKQVFEAERAERLVA